MIRIEQPFLVVSLLLTACKPHPGGNDNAAIQANGKGNAAVDQAHPRRNAGVRGESAKTASMPSIELSQIVLEKQDITVNGEPACAITVRYSTAVEQPVTWRGEGCAKLVIRLSSIEDLKKIGQGTKLSDENLDDLERMAGSRALYIEGEHSSALYPENVMHRVYAVPLAD